MVISEQQRQSLETSYNDLDMGIILVYNSLDLIFINRWFLKRLPEKFKRLWEVGKTFNLKMLYGSGESDSNNVYKIQNIIEKVIKENSIIILSQAFHKWIIPLDDRRFSDGRMRQTCIVQSYRYSKKMALIQIKDESDTVIKNTNLNIRKEQIKEKNRELKVANYQLEKLNKSLKKLNIELTEREKYVKQKSKMEAIGRMAGGIAHDFNNYLFIILGNTEFLMSDIVANEIHYGCLRDIQQAANNAKNIIGEIATFRRSDIDEYDLEDKNITYLHIDTAIRAQISLVKAMLPKSIQLDYLNSNLDTSVVRASSSQIQRVLFNLVINAAHAILGNSYDLLANTEISKKSKIVGSIQIIVKTVTMKDKNPLAAIYKAVDELDDNSSLNLRGDSIVNLYESIVHGKYVAITIYDNGNGIAPDNLEKIFDPYFSTKPVGHGSGIGLSVVHGIVKHLKGALYVQSELNKGTCFTVFLPHVGDSCK